MLSYIKSIFFFVYSCMDFFCIKRYGRAMSQKIYLIDYERSLKTNQSNPFWKFTIMGNSNQCYNLFFSPTVIKCDCIDFTENLNKRSLCKHLFYVFGFVAKFTFQEIQHADFPYIRRRLFSMFDGLFDNKTVHGKGQGTCCICLQTLEQNCHKCDRCFQLIHLDCLRLWLSKNATCPFCRYKTYLSPTAVPQLQTFLKEKKPVFLEEEEEVAISDYPPYND